LFKTACGPYIRLLLCDNYGSYIIVDFMYECFVNNVQMVYLPPYLSHVLQPLNVGVFSVLKRRYRKEITNFIRYNETRPI
jgi:hypothetical protein